MQNDEGFFAIFAIAIVGIIFAVVFAIPLRMLWFFMTTKGSLLDALGAAWGCLGL